MRLINSLVREAYIFFLLLNIVFCGEAPKIEFARHTAPGDQLSFAVDTTLQYHCQPGYATNGFPHAKCLALDGSASWYGPDITCERILEFI